MHHEKADVGLACAISVVDTAAEEVAEQQRQILADLDPDHAEVVI
mgnify:CR=1 FL=1